VRALPYCVTVTELCRRAGITRQWLNKLIDRGEVPCCSRKQNERLAIGDGPGLEEWIERTANRQKKKQGRRLSLQERIDRFQRIPDLDQYTVNDLAKKIDVTVSTVRRRILEIPGVFYDGKAYRIPNTPELKRWIHEETVVRLQEKELRYRGRESRRRDIRLIRPPFLVAGAAISKAVVDTNRVLKRCPLKDWGKAELSALEEDLKGLLPLARSIREELAKR